MTPKKDLILEKYSVLLSDSIDEIEKKRVLLQCDILYNLKKDYVIQQLKEPAIEAFRKFENDTNKYYDEKI